MMLLGAPFIYAFASSLASHNEQIQIPKLKGIENYCSWSIYIQATSKPKSCWDIIVGTQKQPATPVTDVSAQIKKSYQDYI